MIILKAFKDLILMKNILSRKLPHSIHVLGGLSHILEGNMFQLKMCVDSWPTFSTAICYRQKQVEGRLEIPDVCSIFSNNQDKLRRLLTDDSLFKWGKNLEFRVESTHHQILKEIASLRGLHLKDMYGRLLTYIHYSPETMSRPPKTFKEPMTSLSECHAELVLKSMCCGTSKEEINLVKTYIKYLPNYCMVDEKGEPVSWVLTDEFNEIRLAYTQPEYRRAGHLRGLYYTLIDHMASAGLPIFGCIHEENRACQNAVTLPVGQKERIPSVHICYHSEAGSQMSSGIGWKVICNVESSGFLKMLTRSDRLSQDGGSSAMPPSKASLLVDWIMDIKDTMHLTLD
uniref:glycine N-acyltransferase-like protein 3 n=1 Tax=Doryrhamphus excisus TaxID=161450 RepID=UPI0025AE0F5C|nr:glycine N-acyltransferase-like protein 3 [Doryrhamphus excisus]